MDIQENSGDSVMRMHEVALRKIMNEQNHLLSVKLDVEGLPYVGPCTNAELDRLIQDHSQELLFRNSAHGQWWHIDHEWGAVSPIHVMCYGGNGTLLYHNVYATWDELFQNEPFHIGKFRIASRCEVLRRELSG